MTIFRKFLLFLLGSLAVFGLAVFALLTQQRETELRVAEEQVAVREMTRLLGLLIHDQEILTDRVRDYATWDLTHEFAAAQVRDDDWDEISLNTFQSAHVDFIEIYARDRSVLLSQAYDNDTWEPIVAPADLNAILDAAGWLTVNPDATAQPMCASGFAQVEEGVARLALCPILHTDRTGPVAGFIVFGSRLGAEDLAGISELFGSRVGLYALTDAELPPLPAAAYRDLLTGQTTSMQVDGDELIAYTLIPDQAGRPVALLEARQPRVLDRIFGTTIFVMGWVVLGASAAVALGLAAMVYGLVFRRLNWLRDRVQIAAAQGTLAAPIAITRRDELGRLADAVNRLLEGFQQTHREWQQTRVAMLELARFPEQNPTPVLRIGADGNVIYSNPAGTELLRAMVEQAEDPEALLAAWQADVAEALATQVTALCEYHAAGHIFECTFVPFPVPGYVNVYTTDVTDRRRFETELRDERDFAHHVMNTMGQGLTITDAANRFVYVNPAFAQIVAQDAEALIGQTPTDVILAEDLPILAQLRARRLRGEVAAAEVRHTRSDGAIVHTLLTSVPRWRDGAAVGTISVITDLTDRKRVEDQMRSINTELEARVEERTVELATANAALEEERALLAQRVDERTVDLSAANEALARAARLKDEFLANMSHELRTPLNTVLGMAESIAEGIFGPVTDDQTQALGNIAESGRHLLSLINDILDLSKIEAGRFQIHTDVVDPVAICESSLRMIRPAAIQKSLQLKSHLPPDLGAIRADPRRLKQMLVNLLGNAVKFTPEGGSIGLALEGDRDSEQIRFVVWDTGIGIAPEDLARLFRPFTQLDSRLTRQFEGTGLGLSLVSRMAELHGGGVSVESQPGEGSRFTIRLPWPRETLVEGEAPIDERVVAVPTTGPLSTPALVLIVDDNDQNVELLSTYLSARGFRTLTARNGREALERVDGGRPDLVLMDVQMPEFDGLQATRAWRAIESARGLSRTPIVALTALALVGDSERCLEAGMDLYLTKPVSMRDLEAEINRLLTHPIAAA